MIYTLGNRSLVFKYISYNLNNLYDSSLEVSDIYSLDLAKCIYSFLCDVYPQQHKYNASGEISEDMVDIGEYYFNKSQIYNRIVYGDDEELENKQVPVYDYANPVTPEDVSDITKYNIASWNIDDYIIQYLQPGVIVNESSTVDEIAQAQIALEVVNYKPEFLGQIDENFYSYCYDIQSKLKQTNDNIIATGYFDIYVESYIRSMSENF